jgi:uncharacterized protein (TIGR00255 family)
MTKSMTGYGRSRMENDAFTQVWEIRAVNGRFLDLKWRLPLFLRCRETQLEKVVREFAQRGRVDIHCNFQPVKPDILKMSLNRPLAQTMLDQMRQLAEEIGVAFVPDLNRIMTFSSLWQEGSDEPDPSLEEELVKGLRAALEDFNKAREREGRVLVEDISKRLTRLKGWQAEIKVLAPSIKEDKAASLVTRINASLEKVGVEAPEDRILQEVAMLSDKLDVTEELTRMAGHLDRLEKLLAKGGEIGKRLDFLIQETFREINTCGNKAQSLDVSKIVVDFKAELEKIREQAQNIE